MDHQAGRTFLITGANTGIGRATTDTLAARGAIVYMACRSEAKARPVRDEIAAAPATTTSTCSRSTWPTSRPYAPAPTRF